jgi:hypothetical protein
MTFQFFQQLIVNEYQFQDPYFFVLRDLRGQAQNAQEVVYHGAKP